MCIRRLLPAVMTAVSIVLASPADTKEAAIGTIGERTCEEWKAARVEERKDLVASVGSWNPIVIQAWLVGYASGVNSAINYAIDPRRDLLAGVDADTLYLWTDRYCAANPKAHIGAAVSNLLLQLLSKEQKQSK